jgi:hypothetical protein
VRERLVGQRTGIINQIRAFLLERGVAVRQGLRFLRIELPGILLLHDPRCIGVRDDGCASRLACAEMGMANAHETRARVNGRMVMELILCMRRTGLWRHEHTAGPLSAKWAVYRRAGMPWPCSAVSAIGPSTIPVVPVCCGPSTAADCLNYIEIGQSSNWLQTDRGTSLNVGASTQGRSRCHGSSGAGARGTCDRCD